MTRIEKGTTNVYADLGVPDAPGMLVKAQLAARIAKIVGRRNLTQTRAAEILGISQPKLSNILRGRFRGVSETKMLECLTRLGQDVQIVVRAAPRSRTMGQVSVLTARAGSNAWGDDRER